MKIITIIPYLMALILLSSFTSASLVHFYEFENDVTDSIGSNDGTYSGSFIEDSPIDDGFYSIETDLAHNVDFGDLNFNSEFSVCAWVYLNDTTNNVIISQGTSASSRWHFYSSNISNSVYINTGTDNAPYTHTEANTGWTHLCAVSSSLFAVNQKIHLYTNGVNTINLSSMTFADLPGAYYLGRQFGGSSATNIPSRIDNLRIYNSPLTNDLVSEIYFNETTADKIIYINAINNLTSLNIGNFNLEIFYPNGTLFFNESNLNNSVEINMTGQVIGNYTYGINVLGYVPNDGIIEYKNRTKSINVYLNPYLLWLIFDSNSSAIINDYSEPGNSLSFDNLTNVILEEQGNFSEGYITVLMNPEGSKWNQAFQYYNDQTTYIKQYIHIEKQVDLVQTIQVSGDGDVLSGARVCAYRIGTNPDTEESDLLATNCVFTNAEGKALINVDDQNEYRFCATYEGMSGECKIEYIPPSNTNYIQINLLSDETGTGLEYFYGTCPKAISQPTTCTFSAYTSRPYYSICFNYTNNDVNNLVCGYDSLTKSLTWDHSANETMNISVLLNGVNYYNVSFVWVEGFETIVDVGLEKEHVETGLTLRQLLLTNIFYMLTASIVVLLVGMGLASIVGIYLTGSEIYFVTFWTAIWGIAGVYGVLIITAILGIYLVNEKLVKRSKSE